jgi:hypothetical protein
MVMYVLFPCRELHDFHACYINLHIMLHYTLYVQELLVKFLEQKLQHLVLYFLSLSAAPHQSNREIWWSLCI